MGKRPPTALVEPFAIRTAGRRDAAAVARLLTALGYPCTREDAEHRIIDSLAEPDQALLVAELEHEVLGLMALDFMYYLPLGARTCRITALAVDEKARKQGIGRRLLRDAELRARQAGAARLELTTAEHRKEAHLFYQRCGFSDGALRFVKILGTS